MYYYILSLFVCYFNFTPEVFDKLSVVEAYAILNTKKEIVQADREFWQNEFRVVNYYNVKTSMADTKRINKPQQLYKLQSEEEAGEKPVRTSFSKEELEKIIQMASS